MSVTLYATGALLVFASGLAALLPGRAVLRLVPWLAVAGAIAGLAGCTLGLTGEPAMLALPWMIPGGSLALEVDALSAFFAAPVFLLVGAGAIFAERYWPVERSRARHVRIFFGLLGGCLVVVMAAANTILFLAAWELVTIAAFLLVGTDHEDTAARGAAWIYLAASHVAMLALFAMVALIRGATGTWAFDALPAGLAALPAGRAILSLALFGFGIKAGLMPLHIWLPGAHAAAPAHVSALMSGVVIKMGIYGLVRVSSLFDAIPLSFGAALLLLGIASSVLGVALALAQHDLKRLLAYHSIENVGIIVCGLGVGMFARSSGEHAIAALAFAGALLHVWNHGLFKALLFFSAGSVIHATGTRAIDLTGGLARRMPVTAAAFLVGAVAICGLPPLNGFVSELLIYVASFGSATARDADWNRLLVFGVAPALALTGALALACFVKAFGAVFLGTPRGARAAGAHESPSAMRTAMLPLAFACAAIGLAPTTVAPLLDRAVQVASPGATAGTLHASLAGAQTVSIAVAIIAAVALAVTSAASRRRTTGPTWDCGYASPVPRAQYTASSLADSLASIFAWAMPPEAHAQKSLPLFPAGASFTSHVPDPVLDRAILPAARLTMRLTNLARLAQGGRVQLYVLSIGLTLVALLVWSAL